MADEATSLAGGGMLREFVRSSQEENLESHSLPNEQEVSHVLLNELKGECCVFDFIS